VHKRLNIGFLLVLAAIALYLTYLVLEPFLQPVMTAVVLAVSFHPLHVRLERRLGRPALAAAVSMLVVVAVVLAPVTVIAVAVIREFAGVMQVLAQHSAESGGLKNLAGGWLEAGLSWAGRHVDIPVVELQSRIATQLNAWSGTLLAKAGGLLGNVGAVFMKAALVLFTLYFLLREGPVLREAMCSYLPLDRRQLQRLFDGVSETIQASMYGMMIVALVQAGLVGLAFWVLGVPGPVLWGTATIFASLIPVVGTALVWAPAAVWLWLAAGSWVKAVILVGWGAGVVGMADNVLRPYVMSGRVQMHPLVLLFALLGGVQAFGLIGLFAGPVIVASTETVLILLREEAERS
jgi:predicted PurR-regulated permease PerM